MRISTLAPLYPPFASLVTTFLAYWNKRNTKNQAIVFESYRTFDRQAELYAQGRKLVNGVWTVVDKKLIVTNAMPGDSLHNYGLAVDLVFDDLVKPGLQNPFGNDRPWKELGHTGMLLGLEWLGVSKVFPESPHFQQTYGLTLTEIKALFQEGGLQGLWGKLA